MKMHRESKNARQMKIKGKFKILIKKEKDSNRFNSMSLKTNWIEDTYK